MDNMSGIVIKPWYNASSNDGSSCVDVQMYADGSVDTRNSKDPDGPVCSYTREEWAAFVAGVKADQFDAIG